jgi:hypothetical protein
LFDWSKAAMNFRLEDVLQVEHEDERLFRRSAL